MTLKIFPKEQQELYSNKLPNEIQALLFDYYYLVKDGKAIKKYKRRNCAGAANHFEIHKEIINSSRSTIRAAGFILYQKTGCKILIKFTVIDSYSYYFFIFWVIINLLFVLFGIFLFVSSQQISLLLLAPVLLIACGYAIIYFPLVVSIASFKKEIEKIFASN